MDFFNNLSDIVLISGVLCVTVVLIVIISFNQLTISLGKNVISIKKKNKRQCTDCLIQYGRICALYYNEKNTMQHPSKILYEEMRYVGHKLDGYILKMQKSYQDLFPAYRLVNSLENSLREDKEYSFFQEAITNCTDKDIKTEIRRSFKENGFDKKTPNQFSEYLKERVKTIIGTYNNYINNRYPYDMIIPKDAVLTLFTSESIEELIFDTYKNAKQLSLTIKDSLTDLDSRFTDEMNTYIGDLDA